MKHGEYDNIMIETAPMHPRTSFNSKDVKWNARIQLLEVSKSRNDNYALHIKTMIVYVKVKSDITGRIKIFEFPVGNLNPSKSHVLFVARHYKEGESPLRLQDKSFGIYKYLNDQGIIVYSTGGAFYTYTSTGRRYSELSKK
jgi:hypothetical protein